MVSGASRRRGGCRDKEEAAARRVQFALDVSAPRMLLHPGMPRWCMPSTLCLLSQTLLRPNSGTSW